MYAIYGYLLLQTLPLNVIIYVKMIHKLIVLHQSSGRFRVPDN